MPTLPGAEDGVRAARKFLSERLMNPNQFSKKDTTRDLVSSTINQLGILYFYLLQLVKHFQFLCFINFYIIIDSYLHRPRSSQYQKHNQQRIFFHIWNEKVRWLQ